MNPHDKILFFNTGYQFPFLDYFTIFLFFFWLFYVHINFYKNYFIIIILLYFFFHEKYFSFFMFRDVPGCSMFLVLSTPMPISIDEEKSLSQLPW